jgi:hypothetical protein
MVAACISGQSCLMIPIFGPTRENLKLWHGYFSKQNNLRPRSSVSNPRASSFKAIGSFFQGSKAASPREIEFTTMNKASPAAKSTLMMVFPRGPIVPAGVTHAYRWCRLCRNEPHQCTPGEHTVNIGFRVRSSVVVEKMWVNPRIRRCSYCILPSGGGETRAHRLPRRRRGKYAPSKISLMDGVRNDTSWLWQQCDTQGDRWDHQRGKAETQSARVCEPLSRCRAVG